MKKILLVLTVLALTAPCWAAVSVSCSYVGEDVTVDYNCVGDANDIRAFGIQISVDNGGVISDVNVNDADYYIFPGSIDINSQGGVEAWGSAVVSQTSSGFTLEMGSLYDPCDPDHKTVPPQIGTLCTFTVATPLAGCTVSLTRDTSRGGVVMEDGEDYATLSGVVMPYGGCYPAGMADWAEWDTVGRPPCWCNPRQCHGDADGLAQGRFIYWVSTDDLDILSDAWGKGLGALVGNEICADFDHLAQGRFLYRVSTDDLDILSAGWNLGGLPDPNCLP